MLVKRHTLQWRGIISSYLLYIMTGIINNSKLCSWENGKSSHRMGKYKQNTYLIMVKFKMRNTGKDVKRSQHSYIRT
jgi:hypothetical protein